MKTRWYVSYDDSPVCAVFLIDGEHLAHMTPHAEWIEESGDCRKWSTASKSEAHKVARMFKGYGAVARSYTVLGNRA